MTDGPKCGDQVRSATSTQSVYVSAVTEGIEHDLSAEDVVSETVVTSANAPLAISRLYIRQLPDIVLPCAVVGVRFENPNQFLEKCSQTGTAPDDTPCVPFKRRRGDNLECGGHRLFFLPPSAGFLLQFCQKIAGRSCSSLLVFLVPFLDLLVYFGILEFQPVFHIGYVHNAGDGNTVFLQYKALFIEMSTAHNLAQIDPGFGQRNAMHHRGCFLHDGTLRV